jgi:hypothetical protein
MKLNRYLLENTEKNILLKRLDQWKKDLRRMTKLYKSLEASSDPKAIKNFKEARQYWITFRQNWEKWYNTELLKDKKDRFESDISQEEKYSREKVKISSWQAEMALNDLFPDVYDYKTSGHVDAPWMLDTPKYRKGDTRKNKILVYQKKFKEAFDAIQKHIENYSGSVNILKPTERVNVKGINVLISGIKEGEDPNSPNMKRTKKFIQDDLPKAVELINKENIKQTLKGLTIELTLTGSKSVGVLSGAGGSYDYIKDWLRMYPMGMGSDSVPTIIHELGHRYYYRNLSKRAVEAWEKMFHKNSIQIKKEHVDDFWKKYILPYSQSTEYSFDWKKKNVIPVIKKNETNPSLKAIYLHLVNNFYTAYMGDEDAKKRDDILKNRFMENNVNEWIPIEYITDYARTNPSEAFAEVFKLWVTGKKGRLGEWTRAFFKEVVRSGGANIKEEKLIEKYIGGNL